jgi:hypothetical protein
LCCAIGVLLIVGIVPGAMAGSQVVQQLTATPHALRAHGQAKLSLKSPAKGRLLVGARKLAPRSSFDLVVGGIKVGSFTTNAAGRGKIKLSTQSKSSGGLLGVDPRGKTIEVRDGDGDDDLEGQMPGGGDSAAGAFACCSPDDDGPECDVKTPDRCAAKGGTVQAGITSCIPDPCVATPPVVCCLPGSSEGAFVDDDEQGDDDSQGDEHSTTGCAEVTTSQCATAGGTVVNATSCHPNPCAPVSPPQVTVCCVPDGSETECEVLTPDHCTAAHGTPNAAASCESHPCGGGSHGQGGEDGDGSSGSDSGDQGGREG